MKRSISVIVSTLVIGFLFSFSVHAMEAIQTQPTTDGNLEASLTRAQAKGDVLTVMVQVKNVSSSIAKLSFYYQDVYYTDVKEKKKYFILKDADGKYIAGPKAYDTYGGSFEYNIEPGAQKIMWCKLPAPPETTESITVFIPDCLPFEDIEIAR